MTVIKRANENDTTKAFTRNGTRQLSIFFIIISKICFDFFSKRFHIFIILSIVILLLLYIIFSFLFSFFCLFYREKRIRYGILKIKNISFIRKIPMGGSCTIVRNRFESCIFRLALLKKYGGIRNERASSNLTKRNRSRITRL